MSKFEVRSANADDLEQVHAIFSHYVINTVASFYHDPPPLETMAASYQSAIDRGLPYLVAIDTNKSPTKESDNIIQTVLGYTYALPFRPPKISYAPSVEISIYVHPSHQNLGIGTSLLTSLLSQLKGCKHRAVEPSHEDQVHEIPVRNVFAIMAYDINGPAKGLGDRLQKWYMGFGFEAVGRFRNAGWKKGRWLDDVVLQLELDLEGGNGG